MNTIEKEYQQELHLEFLKAMHDEKTKTQEARAAYISSKLFFITGLFGLGTAKVGELSFDYLLYLIPLIAMGYDLYIRAEDLSIKKIGAFLRTDPRACTSDGERAWEHFSARYRDKLAQLATSLFTLIITAVAGVYIFVIQNAPQGEALGQGNRVWFYLWLGGCLLVNVFLWFNHRAQIKKLDKVDMPKVEAGLVQP